MANFKSIQPKVETFDFKPTVTSVGVGDTIQDTNLAAQEIKTEFSVLQVNSHPTVTPGIDPSRNKALLEVVHYRPTMFGTATQGQVNQALEDFVNKVTGSALQSTSISYADLGAFIWLTKEWRALVKDLDRALWIYNQTCIINPVYGKKLIDSIYGTGVYAKLSGGADAINRMRNEIAKKINVQLPMIKGLRWTATDDLCLDNIYIDDPDAKGTLIAFAREGYSVRIAPNGALIGLECFDMWGTLVSYDIPSFCEYVQAELTNLTGSIWFNDVRPYIENLQRKGGFHEDAGISESYMDKVANRTFAPIYCPEVIDMIRNANIFRRKKYLVTSIGTRIEENSNGYLEDVILGQAPLYRTGFVYMCTNKVKNFESYPAKESAIHKSLAFDFVPARHANDDTDLVLLYASGVVITHIVVHYGVTSTSGITYGQINITSNMMGIKARPLDTIPSWYDATLYGLFNVTLDEYRILKSLNAMIKLNAFIWDSLCLATTDVAGLLSTLISESKLIPLIQDVDNIVELDKTFYTNYYNILAYDQVYNADAVQAVAGK